MWREISSIECFLPKTVCRVKSMQGCVRQTIHLIFDTRIILQGIYDQTLELYVWCEPVGEQKQIFKRRRCDVSVVSHGKLRIYSFIAASQLQSGNPFVVPVPVPPHAISILDGISPIKRSTVCIAWSVARRYFAPLLDFEWCSPT